MTDYVMSKRQANTSTMSCIEFIKKIYRNLYLCCFPAVSLSSRSSLKYYVCRLTIMIEPLNISFIHSLNHSFVLETYIAPLQETLYKFRSDAIARRVGGGARSIWVGDGSPPVPKHQRRPRNVLSKIPEKFRSILKIF